MSHRKEHRKYTDLNNRYYYPVIISLLRGEIYFSLEINHGCGINLLITFAWKSSPVKHTQRNSICIKTQAFKSVLAQLNRL